MTCAPGRSLSPTQLVLRPHAQASLVSAGVMLAWIKMGQAAAAVTIIFLSFFAALIYKYRVITSLFSIPNEQKVTGEVTLGDGSGAIDLADMDAPAWMQQQPSDRARGAEVGATPRAGQGEGGVR